MIKAGPSQGVWVAQSVKHLPLAQVMISWDQVPLQAPCLAGSLLLPLPLRLRPLVFSPPLTLK